METNKEKVMRKIEELREEQDTIPTLEEFFKVHKGILSPEEMADQYLKDNHIHPSNNFGTETIGRYRKAYTTGYRDAVECLEVMFRAHQ